jgi:peptidyl-prolyl cis-trans isomerase D
MLKMLRKGAIEKPFILKFVMGTLAVVFVIGMGWGLGGFVKGTPEKNVAEVNGAVISKAEYDLNYEQTYKLYRNLLQENFSEEMVKNFVIENLVEKKLWTQAAREMGLSLGLEELQNTIMQVPSFQNKGRFDPGFYRRVLSLNRLSPEAYEENLREELLIEKAKNAVRDAVVLTDSEIQEAQASSKNAAQASLKDTTKNKNGTPEQQPLKEDKALADLLQQKRQRAILAYQENLKANSKINIQRNLL